MKTSQKHKSICIFQSNTSYQGSGPLHNQQKAQEILNCVPYYGKDELGNNKDTKYIVSSLQKLGWSAKVYKFQPHQLDSLFQQVKDQFCAYMSRINPGEIPGNQQKLNDFLRKLSNHGLKGLLHPDSIQNYGSKQILWKLRQTGLVNPNTLIYHNIDLMKQNLPKTLISGPRVLKRNKGSYGDGVYKIELKNQQNVDHLSFQTQVQVTFAFNNKVENKTLLQLFKFCQQCMLKDDDYFVDVQYLPLISQGQLKLTLVNDQPIFVLHKIPNGFSTNKISGSHHRYDPISKWQTFVDYVVQKLPLLKSTLNEKELPLLWTADFILANQQNNTQKYYLSQINCTCIGFSERTNYGIQQKLAQQIIKRCSQ